MIKVVYTPKQVSDPGDQPIAQKGYVASPSANKPAQMFEALKACDYFPIEFVEPEPLTPDDFKLVHDADYVDNVLNLVRRNGFGTLSQSVVDSLPYTTGAQYTAAKLATVDSPTCALVSGFHHAGYAGWENFGWFCTFNGLMIAAAKLVQEGKRVAIIDCDMHWGNGTDDILDRLPELRKSVLHITFGKHFTKPSDDNEYLYWLSKGGRVESDLVAFKPDVIIYQAGADVHVDDPYGGVLTTNDIWERDLRMFEIAQRLSVPITWNLAGGYQVDPDGGIGKVLNLHMSTFLGCIF